jgi:hypothetical protein
LCCEHPGGLDTPIRVRATVTDVMVAARMGRHGTVVGQTCPGRTLGGPLRCHPSFFDFP